MKGTYSVSLLMQSFDAENHKNLYGFEHKIVFKLFKDEINEIKFIDDIYSEFIEKPYETANKNVIFWKVVKIVDVFEIVDSVPENLENNTELYSRFLGEDDLTRGDILEKYFSDYIWEDTVKKNS